MVLYVIIISRGDEPMRKLKIILLVFMLLLSGCSKQASETIIKDISDNSNFEYELLTVVTEEIESKFNVMEGFGVRILMDTNIDPDNDNIDVYMLNNPTTYYYVTAYPDYMNGGSYVTKIETSDPEIYIYDFSVGDLYTEDAITEYMETLGFFPHGSISSTYVNDRARIRVYLHDGIIIKLVSEVEVTNTTGLIF